MALVCHDKARGMLKAAIYGDACGAPCEVLDGNKKKPSEWTGRIEEIKEGPNRGKAWNYERTNRYKWRVSHAVGQHTDDGDMTITLLQILHERGLPLGDPLIEAYIKWAHSGTTSIGANTRGRFVQHVEHVEEATGIGAKRRKTSQIKTVAAFKTSFDKAFPDQASKERSSQSNGHLMRCCPLALISDDGKRSEAIRFDTGLTNPGKVSQDTTTIYVEMLRSALVQKGSDPRVLEDIARKHFAACEEGDLRRALEDGLMPVFKRKIGDFKTRSWSLHGLSSAVHYGIYAASVAEGINAVIRHGGDTDTNACIVGALLGARFGEHVMLEDEDFKHNMQIVENCDAFIETQASGKPAKRVKRMSEYSLSHGLRILDEMCSTPMFFMKR